MHDGVMMKSMSGSALTPVKAGGPLVAPRPAKPLSQPLPELEPPYHVILHDDDTHTYDYVIEMLAAVFGYDFPVGYKMACAVDAQGRVIVATCHKELAELRVEQIEGYGPDPRMKESSGSMRATMEPAE
jgi:ATP-dependent Clp protease adaptor protein ClpS